MQRERPHRISNVLEFDRAEIARRDIAPPLHQPIRLLGQADASWLANAFETRRDIDAIAHQIAVGFLGHVAKVNADAEVDTALWRKARIALGHAILYFDGATHGVDHAAKLDESAIAGPLDDAPIMRVDSGINQVASQPAQPR